MPDPSAAAPAGQKPSSRSLIPYQKLLRISKRDGFELGSSGCESGPDARSMRFIATKESHVVQILSHGALCDRFRHHAAGGSIVRDTNRGRLHPVSCPRLPVVDDEALLTGRLRSASLR